MINLFAYQDVKYQQFIQKYLPKEENIAVIGVRIPILRKIAKQIIKQDYANFLAENQPQRQMYFEEILLEGIVIAYAPLSLEAKFAVIKRFLPKINNWAVCDSFCASFKLIDYADKQVYLSLLKSILSSDKPYELRFAIVMLLDYYLTPDFADEALALIVKVNSKAYTVQMAKAWAISKYFSLYPEKGFVFLQTAKLNDELCKMTLQKIRDSKRVSAQDKQKLKML